MQYKVMKLDYILVNMEHISKEKLSCQFDPRKDQDNVTKVNANF